MIKVINGMAEKIEALEDKIKRDVEELEEQIPDINQSTDITEALNDRCDELEAKNYQIKSSIDLIIYRIEEEEDYKYQEITEDLKCINNYGGNNE